MTESIEEIQSRYQHRLVAEHRGDRIEEVFDTIGQASRAAFRFANKHNTGPRSLQFFQITSELKAGAQT